MRQNAAWTKSQKAPDWLITAPWPEADLHWQNPEIEARFAVFQQALGAIREIRSRQNIPGKNPLEFSIKCDAATATLLQPMTAYFQSMTNATSTGFGPEAPIPPTHAKTALAGMEIYVDLKDFIDEEAEFAKNEQHEAEAPRPDQSQEEASSATKTSSNEPLPTSFKPSATAWRSSKNSWPASVRPWRRCVRNDAATRGGCFLLPLLAAGSRRYCPLLALPAG